MIKKRKEEENLKIHGTLQTPKIRAPPTPTEIGGYSPPPAIVAMIAKKRAETDKKEDANVEKKEEVPEVIGGYSPPPAIVAMIARKKAEAEAANKT